MKKEVKKEEETNGTHDDETGDNDNENDAADKLLDNNIDNEDSLNLTIGEDEAKIFQDEVRILLLVPPIVLFFQLGLPQ